MCCNSLLATATVCVPVFVRLGQWMRACVCACARPHAWVQAQIVFFLNACVSEHRFVCVCVSDESTVSRGGLDVYGCVCVLLCGTLRGAFSNPSPATSDEPGIIEWPSMPLSYWSGQGALGCRNQPSHHPSVPHCTCRHTPSFSWSVEINISCVVGHKTLSWHKSGR